MTRVAIVTGGAGTLGSAIAEHLVRDGHRVVVAYLTRAAEAATLVEQLGGSAFAYSVRADLAMPGAAKTVVDAACMSFGVPTVLVNNAGAMTHSPIESMSDELWDESLAINLTSAFRLSREVIPGMRTSGFGRIINVSSQAAFRGSVGRAHYCAAKAGMLGLTNSLARELGPDGITVNAVIPGRFVSDLLVGDLPERQEEWLAQTPLARFGTPAELASAVCYLASDGASYITGAALHVGGGLVMG
ncbi:MAG: 3-oxoacyl-ACP reductase family protein [Mycobacteriales bacterium]